MVVPESPSSIATPIMGGTDPGRTSELAAWVAQSDTARVPEIQQWFDRETDSRMRASLVTAAGKLGGRLAVDMLKKCLSDPDGRIRANAVEALMGKVRPEALVGLLHDSDNRCRANAIVALKDHKRVDVLKHLKTMASGDASSRKSAVYAIVEVGTPEATEILKLLDEDPDADVKEKARQAREILTARATEAAQTAEAEAEATGANKADAGAGKFDQLKSRIAEAFGAFRKKLGQ
jgi:HEAT repeat protein